MRKHENRMSPQRARIAELMHNLVNEDVQMARPPKDVDTWEGVLKRIQTRLGKYFAREAERCGESLLERRRSSIMIRLNERPQQKWTSAHKTVVCSRAG